MTVAEIASRIDEDASEPGADHAAAEGADHSEVAEALDSAEPLEPEKSITDRLREPLEGSIYQEDIGELWDPEEGAENRLLLVLEEIGGLEGIPRAGHAVIGLAELWVKHADGSSEVSSRSGAEDEDEDEQEDDPVTQTTREVLEYEPER